MMEWDKSLVSCTRGKSVCNCSLREEMKGGWLRQCDGNDDSDEKHGVGLMRSSRRLRTELLAFSPRPHPATEGGLGEGGCG